MTWEPWPHIGVCLWRDSRVLRGLSAGASVYGFGWDVSLRLIGGPGGVTLTLGAMRCLEAKP